MRVHGSGFTPNSDVYISVKDKVDGQVVLSETIHTSSAFCLFGTCVGGGSFEYEGYPSKQISQCHPGREVRAFDYGMGAWVGPLTVGCQ